MPDAARGNTLQGMEGVRGGVNPASDVASRRLAWGLFGLTLVLVAAFGALSYAARAAGTQDLAARVRFDAVSVKRGAGLSNTRDRLDALGGLLTLRRKDVGLVVMGDLPLTDAPASASGGVAAVAR